MFAALFMRSRTVFLGRSSFLSIFFDRICNILGKYSLSSDFLFSDFRQKEAKAILGIFLIDVLWVAHRKLNLAAGIKKSRVFEAGYSLFMANYGNEREIFMDIKEQLKETISNATEYKTVKIERIKNDNDVFELTLENQYGTTIKGRAEFITPWEGEKHIRIIFNDFVKWNNEYINRKIIHL